MNKILFQGFEIFPMGNVNLSVFDDRLIVENLSNSGLDGVIIRTNGCKNYNIQYGDTRHITEHNATLRTATMVQNELGCVSTVAESVKRFDKGLNRMIFGFNSAFLQDNFNVYGLLDGKKVFDFSNQGLQIIDTENYDENGVATPLYIPWSLIWKVCKKIWQIVSSGMTIKAIYDECHSKQTVHCKEMLDDTNRYVIGYEVDVIYDPVPFELEINNKTVLVDSLAFNYKNMIPEPFIGKKSFLINTVGEQITAYNLPYFEIEKIDKL